MGWDGFITDEIPLNLVLLDDNSHKLDGKNYFEDLKSRLFNSSVNITKSGTSLVHKSVPQKLITFSRLFITYDFPKVNNPV